MLQQYNMHAYIYNTRQWKHKQINLYDTIEEFNVDSKAEYTA